MGPSYSEIRAAAQASHLTYEYLNPTAAGLVRRPEHTPGLVMEWGHWQAGGIWVKRPDVYFGKSQPEELWLELTPPPLLFRAFGCDLDALVHHMRRLSEDGLRALRDARRRPPLGAQKVRRLRPWTEPKTMAEPGGRRVPTFKIGARGLVGHGQRCQAATELNGFHQSYEDSRQDYLAGRQAVFPYGTYGMRVFHRVEVAEPLSDAIVAQPGPLLNDVRGQAEGARAQLAEEVRAAWKEEAGEVASADDLVVSLLDVDRPRERSGLPTFVGGGWNRLRVTGGGATLTTCRSGERAGSSRPG